MKLQYLSADEVKELKPTSESFVLGIDPSFRKSGFAVCEIHESGQVVFFTFKGFIQFYEYFMIHKERISAACVENSNLTNHTFIKSGKASIATKLSRDAGKNQAISQITFDVCQYHLGMKAKELSPKEKGQKITNDEYIFAVMKADRLQTAKKRLNQDERDAFLLALRAKQHYEKLAK